MFTINAFIGWFKNLREGYSRSKPDYKVPGYSNDAIHLSEDERKQRPGETYEEYCKRVPLQFQETPAPKKNYLGKSL